MLGRPGSDREPVPMLLCDDYLTPRSLEEAFDAMDAHRGRFRLVAGATDLLPWAREGRAGDVHIPVLIDVTRVPELRERTLGEQRLRLGAATPIQRFLDDAGLGRLMPAMPRCAIWFADDQLRESATIGGNIVNASPAADATPPLYAHDAVLELTSRRNGRVSTRRVPIDEFITGPGKTELAADEILTAVEAKALPGYGGSFEKVGHRRSLVISTVCLAVMVKLDVSGRMFEDVRLAIGGIGPVPVRLSEAEQYLIGGPVHAEALECAAEMPVGLVRSRTRQEYRREVVRGFMLRGLFNAAQRAGADPQVLSPALEAAYV